MSSSIKKNYLFNTFYQVFNLILPLVTAPYIARVFGAEGVGIQSYTTSIAAIFVLIATFGTAAYGQREVAICRDDRKKRSRTFWEIEFLNIIITSLCLLAWLILILTTHEYQVFYIVLTLQILAVAFDISWLYAAHEDFGIITLRNILVKVAGVAMLFIFVRSPDDLLLYVGILAASGLIGNMSMWFKLSDIVDKPIMAKLNPFHHLKQTFIYFVPSIATSVYTVMDRTMIGIITQDAAENGFYEQASKIVKMGTLLATSLNTVMYSRMSYMHAKKDYKKLREYLLKSLDFTMILGVPVCFGLIGIAKSFVPWFFGPGFDKVALLIALQAPLVLFIGVSNLIGVQYLTPSGQRARSSKGIIVGAVVNFCLNVILIRLLDSVGAVVASLAAEATIAAIYIYMAEEYITFADIMRAIWKRGLAGSIMLVFVLLIGEIGANVVVTIIQIVVGVVVYGIILLVLRDKSLLDSIKAVKRIIRR